MKFRWMLLLMPLVIPMTSQAQAISGEPFVAVHGKAKQEVVPDVFPLEIALEKTSQESGATQAMIEGLAEDILESGQRAGVDDGDIKVSNLDVAPEYRYDDEDDKQVFLGNKYRREIGIRFHSLDKLKEFIAGLPQADVLRISTGQFESSQADALRRDLFVKAIEDARRTAESMATGVGRKLGPVHNISNQGLNLRYSESTELDSIIVTGSRAARAPVVLREGKIELDQDVYIVYRLE